MWPKRSKRGIQEAELAVEKATKALEAVESREGEVQRVVEGFVLLSEENNFAGNLREIMIFRPRKHA